MKRIIVFAVVLTGFLSFSHSQILEPVKWSFSFKRIDAKHVEIIADATIDDDWHLYSTDIPDGGPVPTSLNIDASDNYKTIGDIIQSPEPVGFYDETFGMELGYFSKNARLTQLIEINTDEEFSIKGYVEFMVCDDHRCLPPSQSDFEIKIPTFEEAQSETVNNKTLTSETLPGLSELLPIKAPDKTTNIEDNSEPITNKKKGTGGIFWLSFLLGFAALLTPCVFPMIPLTVSFFLRNADNKGKAIRDGLFYGLTIILAYVIVGLSISIIFGANALNNMATSPIFNLIFFAILIIFASSFFGAFELTMPSKWSTALDNKADKKGGLIGVILMGLTFVLVSFSCTGPIVGTLLVEAAVDGSIYSPAMGMLGFGLALSIPFALFAMFPAAMKSLPKSGAWMNSVKVVLGFIVLAFSLKFFSVADAVGQWGVLDREVFLSIWIAIFILLGLYLIGKIKFAHDSELSHLGVPRLMLAIATFAFVFYLIPGLWGAPLKAVSSFLPSPESQDFNLTKVEASSSRTLTSDPVYSGEYVKSGPHGLLNFVDYDAGMEAAKKAGKPVIVDFTGLGCANCRKMENIVWGDSRVLDLLANEYIIISLYVDLREQLPKEQQYTSEVTGRRIRTVGNKWSDFQIKHYKNNSQPFYVLLNHEEQLLNSPRGYDVDIEAYLEWLEKGKSAF